MLEQHEKFTADKLLDILLQTYIYRLVNKKGTFQRFGGIPSEMEWSQRLKTSILVAVAAWYGPLRWQKVSKW